MTLRQFKANLKAVTKKQLEQQIQFITSTAVASQSTGNDIKKAISDIQKGINNLDN